MISNYRIKVLSVVIAILFLVPIVTSYCCCVEFPWQKNFHHHFAMEQPLGSLHAHHHHGNKALEESENDHNPADEHRDCGHHDHSQCKHSPIIADLVNQIPQLFAGQISCLQKFSLNLSKALLFYRDTIIPEPSPPCWNTGPPIVRSNEAPLYLQLSVLRI